MKKISAVLLIAVLASGLVFAGFSGSATVGFGANFDDGEYGFIGNGNNVQFNVDLVTALGEAKGDGDIYAEITGSLKLFLLNDADGTAGANPYEFVLAKATDSDNAALALVAKIDSAKIIGDNWYVGILGVPGVPDYAKSAIDTWTVENKLDDYGVKKADYDEKATYKVGYEKAPGIEVGIDGYKLGFGLKAKAVKTPEFNLFDKVALTAYAGTPEYELADGVKAQAAVVYSKKDDSAKNAVGGSVKLAYAADALSATVASDLGYDIAGKKFGADVAVNVAYAPVTVDAYYATSADVDGTAIDNLLSAQIVADLNEFDVPVALTVTGKDLINAQDLSAEVAISATDELTITPKGGYVINDKAWNAGLDVKYAADKYTAKAGVSVKPAGSSIQLGASASIESSALISGATVKLAWSDAKDLLDKAAEAKNYGKVVASAKIAF